MNTMYYCTPAFQRRESERRPSAVFTPSAMQLSPGMTIDRHGLFLPLLSGTEREADRDGIEGRVFMLCLSGLVQLWAKTLPGQAGL
jgi:hypothetical protein